jgi:hypothetical protein
MAELRTQEIDIPLSGGLQQAVDKRLLQPGSFLKLRNLQHLKAGSLANRPGYGHLPSLGGRVAQNVATRGDELYALCDGTTTAEAPSLLTYHETVGQFRRQCDAWRVGYERRVVGREAQGALLGQRVVVGSRVVFVWWSPTTSAIVGKLRVRVEDLEGTLIAELGVLSGADNGHFRVAVTNGLVAIITRAGTATNWTLDTLNPATLSYSLISTTLTGVNFDRGAVDMKAIPNAPGFVAIAHSRTADALGSKRIVISTVNVATGAVVQTSPTLIGAVGDDINAAGLHFTLAPGGTLSFAGVAYRLKPAGAGGFIVRAARFQSFTASGGFNPIPTYDTIVFSGLSPPALSTTESYGAALCQDVVSDPNGFVVVTTHDAAVMAKRINASGTVVGTATYRIASSFLLSEPFVFEGRVCAVVGSFVNSVGGDTFPSLGGTRFGSAALVCLYPGIESHSVSGEDPLSRYLMATAVVESLSGKHVDYLGNGNSPDGLAAGTSSHGLMVPSVNANGSISLAPTVLFGAPTSSFDFAIGVDEITFTPSASPTFSCASDVTVSSGGLTAQYDGQRWTEIGFFHRPNVYSSSLQNVAGTAFLAAGTYLYAITYEWIDNAGNVHQSQPAFFSQTTAPGVGNSTKVTLNIRTLGVTQKPNATIAVYRTEKDTDGPFYRLTPRSVRLQSLVNSPDVRQQAYVDEAIDAIATSLGFGLLYTDGGLRPNVLAPATRHVIRHQNRLWAISAEDPNELLFTKLLVKGEPPQFARGLSVRIDGLPSPCTSLGSVGERLVAYTRDGIFYLVGAGPDDTGQNGQFSEAYQVQTTCGSSDPRGVLSTHLGSFFLGPSGIMLADLGLAVAFAGGAVEDETTGRFCRRAIVDETSRRAYWLFADTADGAPADTRFVVFDYDNNAWYTWVINPAAAMRDQCIWRGKHVVCDGLVALQGFGSLPSADPDDSYVVGSFRLPWVNLASVAGFQRLIKVRIVGHRLDRCLLLVDFYIDHDDTNVVQPKSINLGSGSTVSGLPRVRVGIDVKRQLASQHMLEVSHAPAVGTNFDGELLGLEFVSVTYTIGVLRGPSKLAKGNQS